MTITRRWWWAGWGEGEPAAGGAAAVPGPAAERPVKAPLLAHAGVAVDGRAARSWVRRLLKVSDRMNPRTIDAVALLEAAVCQDDARSDALAVAAGCGPPRPRAGGPRGAGAARPGAGGGVWGGRLWPRRVGGAAAG